MIGLVIEKIIRGILRHVIVSDKAHKIGEYLDIKNFSRKKRLFVKLVLACTDEMLNTNEIAVKDLSCVTSIVDKKVTYEKNNCLIYTISLVIICLFLLVIITISCYYYYAKYHLINKDVLSY